MIKTLRVTGEARINVKPDVVVLSFPLSASHRDYKSAVQDLNKKLESLRVAVSTCGMKKEELKTTSFSVEKERKWDSKRGEHLITGFSASHSVSLEFLYDKSYLDQILGKIVETCSDIEFKINFTTSDSTAQIAEEEMLRQAVSNAHKNAIILAGSAGIKLGNVINIDYSHTIVRYEEDFEIDLCAYKSEEMLSPEIEPDDLTAKKSVTLTWMIEDK